MCFTNSVHLIDFETMTPTQKKKLANVHKHAKARKAYLEQRLKDVNVGLKKLETAMKGRKTRR